MQIANCLSVAFRQSLGNSGIGIFSKHLPFFYYLLPPLALPVFPYSLSVGIGEILLESLSQDKKLGEFNSEIRKR
jgi:hypothetical protein